MHCFWSGEAQLGGIDGVLETEAGWIHGKEVVTLKYDPTRLTWESLVKKAESFSYANETYRTADYRIASNSDQKRHLNHSKLKNLQLNKCRRPK